LREDQDKDKDKVKKVREIIVEVMDCRENRE
jgi:hypothetical protein